MGLLDFLQHRDISAEAAALEQMGFAKVANMGGVSACRGAVKH